MRIMHVLNTGGYSGAENVVITIINEMKNNNEIIYVSPDGKIRKYLEENNIKFIPVKKVSIKEINRVKKEFKPDIIHAHDFSASVICSIIAGKTKMISHIHCNPLWIKKVNLYSILFLFLGKKTSKILTVSEAIKKEYVFSKFLKNKIICVNNPVDTESILKKVNIKEAIKEYDICCTARISKEKNPYKFLSIIGELKKKMPNITAIWIGDGELKSDMDKKIKELNLENNIQLLGFQKNPYSYMAKSKVFLLTSNWEGYGLVAFEALTLGLPCVVSNVGGLPNIVDCDCGVVSNNIEIMIEELEKLLNNKEYYNKKSKKAIEKSKEIDNINGYIHNLECIYRKCLENWR